jgi:uncharacterized protein
MPLFVIHALDHPDRMQARLDNYPAHRAYLAAAAERGIRIAASGPLMTEDGTTMIGSLFAVEAADIAAVRAFNAGDPFATAELWSTVQIHRFDVRRGGFKDIAP